MSLQQRIQKDMTTALKERDARRRAALSYIASEIKRAAIDRGLPELTDPDTIAVLRKQLKQRQESLKAAQDAARQDLVAQNAYEIEIVEAYLPRALSEDETRQLAASVITELGASSMKDMGRVMAEAGKRAPAVDKGLLSSIVKARLAGP